jgi:ABC-type phosphate/phosphonate transport system substrate-binding protein
METIIMFRKVKFIMSFIITVSGSTLAAGAADVAPEKKVNYTPADSSKGQDRATEGLNKSKTGDGPLVFSAAPHEDEHNATETYGPIAEYLSKVLGKQVVYKHPGNWLSYQTEMKKGSYDLVFDGPHFNDWRVTKLQHNILVKFPTEHVFVVIVKSDNTKITDLKQLKGRTICAMSPPNLGTLTLFSQFDNPARQPVVINTEGWENIYKGVVADKCVAAVLPLKNLEKYDRGTFTKIIFKGKAMPNQALSAGPRVSREDQTKIVQALIASEANQPTAKLREIYAVDGRFVPAVKREYAGLSVWLKDTWGY